MTTHNNDRDYDEVLHVSRDAPVEIIRGSYRTMMQQLKHHPDLGGDTATAALINEAYAVLGSTDRRAEYDAELNSFGQFTSREPASAGPSESETPPKPADAPPVRRALDPNKECLFCETPHDHGPVIDADAVCVNCRSPLFASENCRIETAGKRAVVRIDKNQDITYFTQWPQVKGIQGRTEDISLHGLRLVTRRSLKKGQRIKIISNVLEAVAMVMHCERKPAMWRPHYVAGVSFEALRLTKTLGGFVSARA